jgi:hypothetical protein
MNKRSAILAAGGVVASFVAGAVSVSSGLGVGNSASATTPTTGPAARVKPIVRHRRIVVHKKAPAPGVSGAAGRTVVLPAPPSTAPISMTSGSHAASGELESETDPSGGDD